MSVQNRALGDTQRYATSDDVRHVLGDVEDTLVAEILAVRPTLGDLTDAAIWARGDGDLIARENRELTAGALTIAEIITRVDEEIIEQPD